MLAPTPSRLRSAKSPPGAALFNPSHPATSSRHVNVAGRIAVIYGVVAVTWIAVSDRLLVLLVRHPEMRPYVATAKGTIFVLTTALLLYVVLNRQFQRLYAEAQERQRAAEVLATRETQLSSALKLAQAAHWEYDVLADRFSFNDHFYTVYRTTAEREGGYTMSARQYSERFVPPEIRTKVRDEIRKAIETSDPNYTAEMESPVIFGDGRPGMVAVRIALLKDSSGRTIKTYGVNQDITERIESAAALREFQSSLRLLSRAVEQCPVSIIITDPTGVIEYANPKFADTTGYSVPEVRGRNLRDLRGGASRPDERSMWDTLAAGRPWQGEYQSTKKNGDTFWESASISPVTDSDGKTIHLILVKEDVTARKDLESQLLHVQKMEAFGQLAGGVAHDFNNILAVMLMQLGLAQVDPNVSGATRSMLADLEKLASRAAALTRQLLIFSRRQQLSIETLDLNRIVEGIWKMLRRLIGENIVFELHSSPAPLWIQADGGMIEQVVMNLCVNARDAMPAGGQLKIVLGRERRPPPGFEGVGSEQAVACLSVMDTGIGMTEETKRRIFEPFFTTKPVGQGTGLGLATVYGIAKQHRGWIEVESTPGQGSTFRVYLPLHDAKDDRSDSAPAELRRGGSELILLVEDEELVRAAFAICLRREGYRVAEACDGAEALREWDTHGQEIALLITDMVMPGSMTGAQLAHRLMTTNEQLKVVLISGYNAEPVDETTPFPRPIGRLDKPCNPTSLLATVRRALDGPAPVVR